jgi:hypothetical protein
MNDLSTLDTRITGARSDLRSLDIGLPPDIKAVRRRHARRRNALIGAAGLVSVFGLMVAVGLRRDTSESAADPQGIGTKIGETPWRLMLMPAGWTGSLVDDDTTTITSAEGQQIELSAEPGVRPPTDAPVVVGPLVDGYSTGATIYVERMGWTLEVAIPGGGTVDEAAAVWLLQSIGRVDIVAPFPDTPLPADIPDVVGMDYEAATEVLLGAGIRSEWFRMPRGLAPLTGTHPVGTVLEMRPIENRVILNIEAPPYELGEEADRYVGGFNPNLNAYGQSRWLVGGALPFGERSAVPYVFLSGEISAVFSPQSPNGTATIQDYQSQLNGRQPSEQPVDTEQPAATEAASAVDLATGQTFPLENPALSYQGLALEGLPDGWTLILESTQATTNGCPTEKAVVLRERASIAAPIDCTRGYGQTLPRNWMVIEPIPEAISMNRGCSLRLMSWNPPTRPSMQLCEQQFSYTLGFATEAELSGRGQYLFFDGVDAVVSAGGDGTGLALALVYADGHSAVEDPDENDFTIAARRDLDELRAGGRGCTALVARAEPDFDLAASEAIGTVAGTVFPDTGADMVGRPDGIEATNINPQPDARGTMISLKSGDVETPYLLAHRYVWNPETLAGEWRIASIERYTGIWPPPRQLPGRPPSQTLPD